jgi:hypothetical protein
MTSNGGRCKREEKLLAAPGGGRLTLPDGWGKMSCVKLPKDFLFHPVFLMAALLAPAAACQNEGGNDDGEMEAADFAEDFAADEAAEEPGGDDVVEEEGQEPELPACGPGEVASAVSVDEIRGTIEALLALGDRSTHEGQQAASALLQDRLAGHGVAYEVLEYDWNGSRWSNLEITIPGSDLPGEILAAGAHYDTDGVDIPGADDNASGTAGIVEIARVLSGCGCGRTIRLLLFSNEETGSQGSSAYAAAAAGRGDDIRAFLDLDMIAYGPPEEDLDVMTRPEFESLTGRVASAAEAWVPGFAVSALITEICGCGDDGSFWNHGYAAACLIEDYDTGVCRPAGNPTYHTPGDDFDVLNLDLCASITRVTAAALVTMADE